MRDESNNLDRSPLVHVKKPLPNMKVIEMMRLVKDVGVTGKGNYRKGYRVCSIPKESSEVNEG